MRVGCIGADRLSLFSMNAAVYELPGSAFLRGTHITVSAISLLPSTHPMYAPFFHLWDDGKRLDTCLLYLLSQCGRAFPAVRPARVASFLRPVTCSVLLVVTCVAGIRRKTALILGGVLYSPAAFFAVQVSGRDVPLPFLDTAGFVSVTCLPATVPPAPAFAYPAAGRLDMRYFLHTPCLVTVRFAVLRMSYGVPTGHSR